jgi:hypothetical protein
MVAWIWVIIGVISDVFHSKDLSGVGKGLWVLFVIIFPWLGILCYLIIRGRGMEERNVQVLAKAEEIHRAYIQRVAGTSTSTADELSKLAELRDKGVINEAEFETQKGKLLS